MSTEVKPARKRTAKRTTAKSKPPVKRKKTTTRPAGKKKTVATPAKKRKTVGTKKKTTTASRKKTTTKARTKAAPKKTSGGQGGFHRELDETGMFVVGTDSSVIASMLLAGGKDRADINAKVAKKIGTTTRNDTERNIPALVSGVLKRLEEAGYKVESSFTLVAPARKRRKK